jgi:hypothetical protein
MITNPLDGGDRLDKKATKSYITVEPDFNQLVVTISIGRPLAALQVI